MLAHRCACSQQSATTTVFGRVVRLRYPAVGRQQRQRREHEPMAVRARATGGVTSGSSASDEKKAGTNVALSPDEFRYDPRVRGFPHEAPLCLMTRCLSLETTSLCAGC